MSSLSTLCIALLVLLVPACASKPEHSALEDKMQASLGRGRAHYHSGQLNRALGSYRQALLLAQVRDNQTSAAEINISIGSIELLLKHYPEAEAAFKQAQLLAPNSGQNNSALQATVGLGNLAFQQQHYAKSLGYFQQTLAQLEASGQSHTDTHIRAINGVAINLKAEGALAQALEQINHALDLINRYTGKKRESLLADSLYNKGSIEFAMSNRLAAKHSVEQALQLDKSLERLPAIAADLELLARIEGALGNPRIAQLHRNTAQTIRQHLRR